MLEDVNNYRHRILDLCREHMASSPQEAASVELYQSVRTETKIVLSILKDRAVLKPFTDNEREILQVLRSKFVKGGSLFERATQKVDKYIALNASLGKETSDTYASHSTLTDIISLYLTTFKNAIFMRVRNTLNQQIYRNWSRKIEHSKMLREVTLLNKKQSVLLDKVNKDPANTKLSEEFNRNQIRLSICQASVNSYIARQASEARMRTHLYAIGGTAVHLSTKDHVELDAVHLSAEVFYEKLKAAGVQSLKLCNRTDFSHIQGLMFNPSNTDSAQLFKEVRKLGMEDAGWSVINIGTRCLFIPDFEKDKLLLAGHVEKRNGHYCITEKGDELYGIELSELKFDPKDSGTVLLDGGIDSHYETNTKEALGLLLQGSNVMLFNRRGQGQSTGKPSEYGSQEDLETVYRFLKDRYGIEDKKLVVHGRSLSGASVAKFASHHPEVNLVLDQTYANLKDIFLKEALDSLKNLLSYRPEDKSTIKKVLLDILSPFVHLFVNLTTPEYTTIKYLNKIKGKVLILRAENDQYVTKEMTDKIVESLSTPGAPYQFRCGHLAGEHGDSWLQGDKNHEGNQVYLGRYHMLSFLKDTGNLNPVVDGGQTLKKTAEDYESYSEYQAEFHIKAALREFNPNETDLDGAARAINKKVLSHIHTEEIYVDDEALYSNVLSDLDRLKLRLGAKPDEKHSLGDDDGKKVIFGYTLGNIKDNIRGALLKNYKPHFIWGGLEKLYKVDSNLSQYANAYVNILRYRRMISNKSKFFAILDQKNKDQYEDFGLVTGMMWHLGSGPDSNSPYHIKEAITLVDQFLTLYYEAAKSKGDDALVEYYNSFWGVCFEERVKKMAKYIKRHPLEETETKAPTGIVDLDGSKSVENAFDKCLSKLGIKMRRESKDDSIVPTRSQVLEYMNSLNVFDQYFTNEGQKVKPSMEEFEAWAEKMISYDALDPDPHQT